MLCRFVKTGQAAGKCLLCGVNCRKMEQGLNKKTHVNKQKQTNKCRIWKVFTELKIPGIYTHAQSCTHMLC